MLKTMFGLATIVVLISISGLTAQNAGRSQLTVRFEP